MGRKFVVEFRGVEGSNNLLLCGNGNGSTIICGFSATMMSSIGFVLMVSL